MQTVFFFFDDSGNLHKNEKSGIFVYAGYVFTDREMIEQAKRKYINANRKIKHSLGRTDELKASNICNKHRRALFNAVKEYESVSLVVEIGRVYDYILSSKKAVCRYKDYILKR